MRRQMDQGCEACEKVGNLAREREVIMMLPVYLKCKCSDPQINWLSYNVTVINQGRAKQLIEQFPL